MKLKILSLAIAVGITWAGCILLVGLIHVAWPIYGGAFLGLVASIYPGFDPSAGIGGVLVGTAYGLIDGTIGGAVVAWIYNFVAKVEAPVKR